jgi:hypothetical protein
LIIGISVRDLFVNEDYALQDIAALAKTEWIVKGLVVVFNGMGHCGMCKGVGNNVVG